MTVIPFDLIIHKPKKELLKLMQKNEIPENILWEKDSEFHNISVVENLIGRFLKYDDTYQAGWIKSKNYIGNLPYINYFLIPCLMNMDIKNVLLIGFGSGIIVNQLEKILKNIKTIDIVDIEENILEIANSYFDFNNTEKQNFYLQDAIVYLKTSKKKYDLIIVDVAGNEGIDERFCDCEYLNLIKSRLSSNGIFVSNMPSSRDIFNPKNKFALDLIKRYKNKFDNVLLFNGEKSNKIFYKTFFNIDEPVLDITNLIMISSDKKYEINDKNENLNEIIDIKPYLADLIQN